MSGHPPFAAQVMLNGHEYVACAARQRKIEFTKNGNCLTDTADAGGLAAVADTLSQQRTIGRLSQLCERWIYSSCLLFALNLEEQKRSEFQYQYSICQMEYSRHRQFWAGGQMEQVFQSLIDRTRAPLGWRRVKTILPSASRVGKTTVGGVDFNRPRMGALVPAVIVLAASPKGFTASEAARHSCGG